MQTLHQQQVILSYERDRWLEPGRDVVIAVCDTCNDEVYSGQKMYSIDGEIFCEDCMELFSGSSFSEGFENLTIICEDCTTDVKGDYFYVINEKIICEDCLERYCIM